ncbi:MAG: MFS transporter [Anaerolineae bacterium]
MTQPDTPPITDERLPWWRKIGYGLGDIYGGGAHLIISFYYLHFLTSVVRINPALAGTVILISKIYDAITDPLEGVLTDRTRTRFGRRKPYLAAGVILIFLSFFALFYPFSMDSEGTRFAYVLLTYLFFSTVFSIVQVNYNALQSEMTLDYNERTSLSGVRIFFSTASSIVCAIVPLEIVKQFQDVKQGYIVMALAFGLFFALPYIVTVLTIREREEFQRPPQPFDWRRTFLQPFKMRTFVHVLLMYLFAFTAADIVSSVVIYFMTYTMGRGAEANYVNGTLLVVQVLSLPFYTWISRRNSKRTGFIIGGIIWIVAMLLSFFITPDQPRWVVYAFAAFVGSGTGGIVVMIYAMFPDIPDVDELISGERREGMYYAMIGFSRKFSSALALFLVSQALAIGGYVAPVEQVIDGVTRLVEQPQTARFLLTLRLLFGIAPILLLSMALVVAFRYRLTPDLHNRLKLLLAARRRGAEDTPEQAREARALRAVLIDG